MNDSYCLTLPTAEDPSTLPPALQLAHYDADAHGQTPASPAHSGSGSRGPPSENGDASPTLAKKPIDARLSDLPVQSPASQKDDRYSSNTRATHKTGSTSSDNQGHVSRSYQEPASDVASSYPYQGSHEPDTGHYYTGGRKPSATEVPPLPASVPPPARMDSGDRRSSYASDAPSDGRYDDRHYTEEQGHGYKSQVSAQRASAAPAYDSGSYSQHSGYQQEEVYPSRYSSQGQGGSYSEASTLPYGTAPPHASHPTQAATLDYGAKPPVAAKPEKKKHGFFAGVFNKGKKEKEKDAKK